MVQNSVPQLFLHKLETQWLPDLEQSHWSVKIGFQNFYWRCKLATSNSQENVLFLYYVRYRLKFFLYFLITIQLVKTTRTGPQGPKDNDYPVAMNIETFK